MEEHLVFALICEGEDNIDAAFGDFGAQDSSKVFVKATAAVEDATNLIVDTKAPTITTTDTAVDGKYTYSPICFTITDEGSGLDSVTFDGKQLGTTYGNYELDKSGTLTAVDKMGNTTTLNITIDDSALKAAREAIAKLPDSGANYKNKADLESAEKAVAALDSVAKSKLTETEQNKVATAREAVNAIEKEIAAAEEFISKNVPQGDVIQPTQANIKALSDAADLLNALAEKGVEPETDVSNYAVYKKASDSLNSALKEVEGVKEKVAAFVYGGYGDKQAVSDLRKEVADLQNKYGKDILSADALQNLTNAEATVAATETKIQAVADQIQKLPTSLNPLSTAEAAVNAAEAAVQDLVKEGVTPEKDIAGYDSLVKMSEQVKAANAEVAKLKEDIAAFTYQNYGDKDAAVTLRTRLDKVTQDYGVSLTDAEKKNLTDAETAIAQIEKEIKAAEALIETNAATPLNPLQSAEKALEDTKTAVQALTEKGVKPETDISNYSKLEAFEKSVQDAQAAVKAVADEIANFQYNGYSDKATTETLRQKADALKAAYGDALTADQLKNLTEAEQKIQDTEKKITETITLIDTLPDSIQVTTENITLVSNIDSKLNELSGLGVDNEKTITNYQKYATAKAALGKAMEEIDAVKAELNAFTYVNYGQSAEATRALRAKADALITAYGNVLAESDLAKLVDGEKKIADTETEIASVIAAIDTLPGKDAAATLAQVEAIDGVTARVDALLKGEEVPQDKITNYAKYTDSLAAKANTEEIVQKVNAQVDALPDTITLEAEVTGQVAAVQKNAADAQAKYGDANHQVLTESAQNKLDAAVKAVKDLQAKREALVKKIADPAQLPNADSIKLTDQATVKAIREEITTMQNTNKAEFSDDELARLTAAETELANLQKSSEDAHAAIAALPGADTVKLTQKADITALETELARLEARGDSFTAKEKQKIQAAKDGIADLEAKQAAMKTKLGNLKADVKYSDKEAAKNLENEIQALQDRGVTVDKTTMGDAAWENYNGYKAAVAAMNTELETLNNTMQEKLNQWTYASYDAAEFDALRASMDAAADKYGMTQEQKESVFPNYDTDQKQAAAANEMIQQANDQIAALPKTITNDQKQDVESITALLNALKAAPYQMSDTDLQTALGDNYQTYKAAVDTLTELNKPRHSSNSSSNKNTASEDTSEYIICTQCGHQTWMPYLDGYQCTNCGHLRGTTGAYTAAQPTASNPKTGDDTFPLSGLVTLAAASMSSLAAMLFKKKRSK